MMSSRVPSTMSCNKHYKVQQFLQNDHFLKQEVAASCEHHPTQNNIIMSLLTTTCHKIAIPIN